MTSPHVGGGAQRQLCQESGQIVLRPWQEMGSVDCSVSRPGREMGGQAQGWLSSGSQGLATYEHAGAAGRREGREELGPGRTGQPWALEQALSLGMVASNQEQPTEDLAGLSTRGAGLLGPGTRARLGFSAWPSL